MKGPRRGAAIAPGRTTPHSDVAISEADLSLEGAVGDRRHISREVKSCSAKET